MPPAKRAAVRIQYAPYSQFVASFQQLRQAFRLGGPMGALWERPVILRAGRLFGFSHRLVPTPDPMPALRAFDRFGFLRGLIETVKLLVFLPRQARPDRLGRLNRRTAKATILPTSPPPKGTAFRDCLARQKLTVKTKRSHDTLGPVPDLKRPDAAMAAPPSRMTGRTAETPIRPGPRRKPHKTLQATPTINAKVFLTKLPHCPRVVHPRRDFESHFDADTRHCRAIIGST
jgi:hypothetical protein